MQEEQRFHHAAAHSRETHTTWATTSHRCLRAVSANPRLPGAKRDVSTCCPAEQWTALSSCFNGLSKSRDLDRLGKTQTALLGAATCRSRAHHVLLRTSSRVCADPEASSLRRCVAAERPQEVGQLGPSGRFLTSSWSKRRWFWINSQGLGDGAKPTYRPGNDVWLAVCSFADVIQNIAFKLPAFASNERVEKMDGKFKTKVLNYWETL